MATLISPTPASIDPFSAFDLILATTASGHVDSVAALPVSIGALVILAGAAALVLVPLLVDLRISPASPPRPAT